MPASKKMLVALETFAAQGRTIRQGDLVAAADPIVKGREVLFEAHDPKVTAEQPPVEAATAGPEEQRP
jgi:hypothetical protein